ncbi:MAG: hypothetical protein E6J78_15115 [Deltaproteobacteria bacterium]|nr:MAG: hypothetical protein E6J78_15115 [Deltaproteobacteria bacterium]
MKRKKDALKDVLKDTDVQQAPPARRRLIRDPNLNQADNDRGSLDQSQGSQTGNEVDPLPEK